MKKAILILFSLGSILTAAAQQFSFKMYFKDAIGNTDSITLGYDPSASDTIDISYGEVNIISTPLDSGLDVRITDEWDNRIYESKPGTYHTKKQIFHYDCIPRQYPKFHTLEIHTKHWPVTAYWSKSLFTNACRLGSIISGVMPAGWPHIGGNSDLYYLFLSWADSVTFSSNTSPTFDSNMGTIRGIDTISFFWVGVFDLSGVAASNDNMIYSRDLLKIYPNPASDYLSVEPAPSLGVIQNVQIYSLSGDMMYEAALMDTIPNSFLNAGVYVLVITNEKHEKYWNRFRRE